MMQELFDFIGYIDLITDKLNKRAPFDKVEPKAHVGVDRDTFGIAQLQSFDANIQATVGIDLAQLPKLFQKLGEGSEHNPKFGDVNAIAEEGLSKSAKLGKGIADILRKRLAGSIPIDAQNLNNLEGLLSLVALYLWMGARYTSLLYDDLKMSSVIKNFVPLMSRGDLSTIFQESLTWAEQDIAQDNLDIIKKALIRCTNYENVTREDEKLLVWENPTSDSNDVPLYASPVTRAQFIENVFTASSDGFTDDLARGVTGQLKPESVGPRRNRDDAVVDSSLRPHDGRRQGAVLEFRSLANRISPEHVVKNLSSKTKFPPDTWNEICWEIFETVRILNAQKPV